ncbi:MAG: LuxR family transcriptional regulator [Myxococcales bacterium FL481]|nr:MAG: LuxR family transcriptional regulator [Myxococcales bacterium FL481]
MQHARSADGQAPGSDRDANDCQRSLAGKDESSGRRGPETAETSNPWPSESHMTNEHQRLQSLLDDLRGVTSSCHRQGIIADYVGSVGLPFFAYLLYSPSRAGGRVHRITNYPTTWAERYAEENYVEHDFVFHKSWRCTRPFQWPGGSETSEPVPLSTLQQAIFFEARSVGLRSGASFPLHGPGHAKACFSIASGHGPTRFAELFERHKYELRLAALYLHDNVVQEDPTDTSVPTHSLTPREVDVLSWVARGKTYWEVSMILSISEHTVKEHLHHARKKLGATNTTHAVAIALQRGAVLM